MIRNIREWKIALGRRTIVHAWKDGEELEVTFSGGVTVRVSSDAAGFVTTYLNRFKIPVCSTPMKKSSES